MFQEPSVSELYPEHVAAAERSLVQLALTDPDAALGCNVERYHFHHARHAAVWGAVQRLRESGREVEPIGVAEELASVGKLEGTGGLAFICSYLDGYTDPSLVDRYAEFVRTGYATRELRRVAAEVPLALARGASVQEVADRLRNFVDKIETVDEQQCTTLDVEVASEVDRITSDIERLAKGEAIEAGLPSGLGLERVALGGIPRDRVTLLFGETGTFKTALKQIMSDAITEAGHYVLDFTLEDSAELTAQRYISRKTGIPYGRLAARELTDQEVARCTGLSELAKQVASRTLVVGSVPATVEEAVRLSRYYARKHRLGAVFLDYVQLLETNARDTEARATLEAMKAIQRAAHRDKLAWVVLSQVNREASNRDDKRPILRDLYGGSAIAQLVKLAVGIYRPWAHEPVPSQGSPWHARYTNHPNGRLEYPGVLELWVRKCVNGEINTCIPGLIDPGTGRFTVLTKDDL